MRIGYFGGSFDPPHRGHLAVSCAARDRFALDRVLLVPTGRQPFKPAGAVASFADRLAMVQLLCEGHAGLQASPLDAPHPDGTPNYTADALGQLQAELPAGSEIFIIVGADAFLGVAQWHEGPALLQENRWIVVSRPGVPAAALEACLALCTPKNRPSLLDSVWDPASATDLRADVCQGRETGDALVPAVADYIRTHRLYMLCGGEAVQR